ncbi:peptidase domain-containing ABC transporter [Tenacibaculum ovolyticum]|uniref:peptidase domain-containing ABC transporter n=1 Tax=Tenacibaculum ovolyticum TaxID=104270 RepID=UPI0022F3E394|nr:peptidase domain-containing ABC transporter [Tenacibaculum ovolyticum]WBX76111.1 peptidase domain-containing ABC transporter [Tenacibaculum ovolyticum]
MRNLNKIHVKQKDLTDCGVACLLMLIKFYDGNNSIENIRNISGTSTDGTTLLGLYQAANKLGFKAQGCEAEIVHLKEHKSPLILHILTEEKLEHYVVLFKFDEEKKVFIIGDPEKGIEYYTEEELKNRWVSKACLTVEKTKKFDNINDFQNDNKSKIKWVFSFLKEDYDLLIFSTLTGLIISILGLGTSVFSQVLIDDIIPKMNNTKLMYGIALLGIVLLLKNVLTFIRGEFLIRQKKSFNIRINSYFLGNLLKLPTNFFKTRKSGDFVSRLHDSFKIQNLIQEVAGGLVIDLMIFTISILVLFYYSTTIGLITVCAVPLYFLIIVKSNKKLLKYQKNVMINYSEMESNFINLIKGIGTIKLFSKTSFFNTLSQKVSQNYQDSEYKLSRSALGVTIKWGLLSTVLLLMIISVSGGYVITSQLKPGELVAIIGIMAYLLPSVSNIASIIVPYNESKVAFDRMLEYSSAEKEVDSGEDLESSIDSINIRNLSFRYTGRNLLLNNLNLDIKKGEIVGLIGDSGSGKSTIVGMLERIYDFESGVIEVNSKTIDYYNLNSWRESIGIIAQSPSFFSGSVIDNILMDNYSVEERQALEAEMKTLGIDSYIKKMNNGYDTIVGENGVNISGGQKQIVSFARVLNKKPKFIILDEATSAMDKEAQIFFLNLMKEIKVNIPMLFISHNTGLVEEFSDEVYFLKDKSIFRENTSLKKVVNF